MSGYLKSTADRIIIALSVIVATVLYALLFGWHSPLSTDCLIIWILLSYLTHKVIVLLAAALFVASLVFSRDSEEDKEIDYYINYNRA